MAKLPGFKAEPPEDDFADFDAADDSHPLPGWGSLEKEHAPDVDKPAHPPQKDMDNELLRKEKEDEIIEAVNNLRQLNRMREVADFSGTGGDKSGSADSPCLGETVKTAVTESGREAVASTGQSEKAATTSRSNCISSEGKQSFAMARGSVARSGGVGDTVLDASSASTGEPASERRKTGGDGTGKGANPERYNVLTFSPSVEMENGAVLDTCVKSQADIKWIPWCMRASV